MAGAITSDVRGWVALISLLYAAPRVAGGLGLLERKPWSWGLVLILAGVHLLSIPVGTLVGGYALWALTRPGARQALGVGAGGPAPGERPRVRGYIKAVAALSLLLLVASYPACQLGEQAVQAEPGKLPAAELEQRQFNVEYVRWVLPGIFMLCAGVMLAAVATVSWVAERTGAGRKDGADGGI